MVADVLASANHGRSRTRLDTRHWRRSISSPSTASKSTASPMAHDVLGNTKVVHDHPYNTATRSNHLECEIRIERSTQGTALCE